MEQLQNFGIGIGILCGVFGVLFSVVLLIAWEYYKKIRHDNIYTIAYRVALASVAHFGSGAAHGVRVEWALVEAERILGAQRAGLVECYIKASLAVIVPHTTTDDDEEVESMFED